MLLLDNSLLREIRVFKLIGSVSTKEKFYYDSSFNIKVLMNVEKYKLSKEQYVNQYQEIHDSIFSERPIYLNPFQNDQWERVLFSCTLALDEPEFTPLSIAAQKFGDVEAIVTDAEFDPPDSMKVPWEKMAFEKVWALSGLGHLLVHVYGFSRTWGMVIDQEKDYACLGGSIEFMTSFLSEYGGKDKLKEDFLRMVEADWKTASKDLEPINQILRSVGWE